MQGTARAPACALQLTAERGSLAWPCAALRGLLPAVALTSRCERGMPSFLLLEQTYPLSEGELAALPDSVLTVAAGCERSPDEPVQVSSSWREADADVFEASCARLLLPAPHCL